MKKGLFAFAFLASLPALTSACKKDPTRCHYCGMHIEQDSAWSAEVKRPDGEVDHFDTPRCAFGSVVKNDEPKGSVVRVQDFYDRKWLDANNAKFAVGSDVTGPMGADLVPLSTNHADQFSHDHSAGKVVTASQIDAKLLGELR